MPVKHVVNTEKTMIWTMEKRREGEISILKLGDVQVETELQRELKAGD